MKNLNASEVSNVVGGTYTNTCLVSYAKVTTGTGSTAVNNCYKTTVCKGKYGETSNREEVALTRCAA